MKHWDSISSEFDENSMSYKSSMSILFDEISRDFEFLFYILRVNNLYTKEKMKNFSIDVRKFLEILKFTLKQKMHFGIINYSVLKDPVSDKLPDDYESLIEKDRHQYAQVAPQHQGYQASNYYPKPNINRYGYKGKYYESHRNDYYPERPPLRYYNEYQPKRGQNQEPHYREKSYEKNNSNRKNSKKSSKKSPTSSLSSSGKSKRQREKQEKKERGASEERQSREEGRGESFKFDKFKKGKKEFQSSRYYKTSIDSKSENEDIYSKERKNRRQRLGSSISLESDKIEKEKSLFDRNKFSNFRNQNRAEYRPSRNYYDD